VTLDDLGGAHARRACQTRAGMMSAVAAPEQLPAEQRARLQRAHERLRTASQELQSLVATDPVKNRWAPEPAPATILEAAHSELEAAYAALTRCHAQILARAAGTLDVVDKNQALSFSFADLMRHHGPVSPGGVAHAFKVMQRAFPLLEPAGPIERRAVGVATAFGGPGARDGFEAVTRAVTGERYVFDPELAWPERGMALERFVFRLSYRERSVRQRRVHHAGSQGAHCGGGELARPAQAGDGRPRDVAAR